MPALSELQRAMAAHMLPLEFGPVAGPLAALIAPDGLSVARRLAVHRNNMLAALTAALAESHPVVRRLVGAPFFDAAAGAYVAAEPPREARLSHYGGGFAGFLEHFPPARPLAYLPDVARLEWAVNECFYAADAPTLDPARLSDLTPDQSTSLRLRLHPSCRLIESPYPIECIWRANQPDADGTEVIDLAAGGCRLLLRRDGRDIRFAALGAGELALLTALAQGRTLGDSYAAAAAAQPDFDLAASLRRSLAAGLFVDIDLGGQPA